ncbi:hypothetical protein PMZ80_003021 [Knufia obscura]|uniref:Uncharacterized protein n=2 Tax=Knufia TaxID=430999 RepID=A0AAN8F6R1_9EURO|nr:hypothetical protein PMZ80_003021 [Knufia obscura]KAK5952391.1 hypothetical protein OHC33_006434 [Knufia fluminis]
MFNENFSFVSGTSDPLSADISPFTSRCASPHHTEFPPEARRSYRDTRYDTYRPRHQSITALTAQLESHILADRRRPSYTSDYQDEPSPSEIPSAEQDEGYYEGPDTPSTTSSDYSAEFDPALYDLGMSDLSATSSPRPSLSLEAQACSSHSLRRRQRTALIRLQCLAKRTPDLAMLIEECHPSSLPMPSDFTPRSGSTCSITSGRIEKDRRRSSAVHRSPKMRKERR